MQKTIKINNLIFNKIKFRYHFFPAGGYYGQRMTSKLLLDSIYPSEVAKDIISSSRAVNLVQSGYAISERVAEDMNCKKLHISELISMLGYTKTDITKLLQAVKNKELKCVLIGLGGTGSNFLHWMYEMAQWTGKSQIFKRITAYDDDEFDIPNMLRIPFMPQFNSEKMDALKANNIPRKFSMLSQTYMLLDRRMDQHEVDASQNIFRTQMLENTFIYGAPGIGSREWLSQSNMTFFAATHRDNEYSIVENPSVDNDLMMETYGKINLSMFFLNHLSMTIDFLTHLSTRENNMFPAIPIVNETIVREDFGAKYSEQIRVGFKAGAKKLYPISDSGRTEELNLAEGEI